MQPVSQQKPSTQLSLTHSLGPLQLWPLGLSATHCSDVLQWLPEAQSVSNRQLVGQLTIDPLHKNGVHDGSPAEPCSIAEQTPSLPVKLQASQGLTQLVLQQNPLTQLSLSQPLEPKHGEPLGCLMEHTVLSQ